MTIQRAESLLPVDSGMGGLGRGGRESVWQRFRAWVQWFRGRLAKQRSRRALARLDDRLLEDVGITQKARERELSRSFWD